MNELSLFTGAGGGILGTHLLGWTPIGYVEWDDYCQRVLAQRIADGLIPRAPIFGDVRQFMESGAAREYRGFADVVSAGFPCQPHSVAGKQLGADDPRDMWSATAAVIREVRPGSVLLENVPGILAGYAARVIADLAGMGYVGRTGCISAADTGAPHRRMRWWVVAHSASESGDGCANHAGSNRESTKQVPKFGDGVSHENVADADSERNDRRLSTGDDARSIPAHYQQQRNRGAGQDWRCDRWPPEPELDRVADGMANDVDRLKALGNGQVPRVVAAAWRLLS